MSELRPIQQSLPLQLLKAREAAMSRFRPMLRSHDLTEQQWRVIRVLAAEGSLDAGDLAARTYLLAPSLTRILQTLDNQGLISRRAASNDQRRSLISLTTEGQQKFTDVSPHSEALYQLIERQFGSQKLTQLYNLLDELTVSIKTDGKGEARAH